MIISNEFTAKRLLDSAMAASDELNKALVEIKTMVPAEEFFTVRTAVGRVLGELHCELVGPLWEQHPALAPAE